MHGQDSGVYLIKRTGLKLLSVVSKRLVGDRMNLNPREDRCRVETPKKTSIGI